MASFEDKNILEPTFDPQKWHAYNDHDLLKCDTAVNCYSYALDTPGYYWSVPGYGYANTATPHFFDSFTALFGRMLLGDFHKELIDGAVKDGLTPLESPENTIGRYTVALFLSDETKLPGFHWYRQDSDGTWSHKNGFRSATNLDPEAQAIFDPRQIKDPFHSIFGGFFSVPVEGISLQQDFPLIARLPE